MQPKTNAEKDCAADVTTAVTPVSPWRVSKVAPLSGFQLHVQFNDGVQGRVLMDQLIHAEDAGVFDALQDPEAFLKVRVELGVVTWPGGQDLAPDAMYHAIRERGEWVPA